MMKPGFSRIFLLITGIFLLFTLFLSCEKEKYDLLDPEQAGVWTHYDTSTGLPGNGINDIYLDESGKLWVAFSGGKGVASWEDGYWQPYRTENSSIISDYCTRLGSDVSNTLIIGTTDGLSFKAENDEWSSYQDPARTMTVYSVKYASNGTLWVGTQNEGFYYQNQASGVVRIYDPGYPTIYAIEEDSEGNIWLGSDNGLIRWNGSVSASTVLTTGNGLPSDTISSLFSDSRNRLWIGNYGGRTVSWLDEKNELHQLNLFAGADELKIRDIFEDRRGDIWFATRNDGLIRFDGVVPYSYKVYNGFPEDDVSAVAEDNEGNLWFGLYSKGIVKYTLPLE